MASWVLATTDAVRWSVAAQTIHRRRKRLIRHVRAGMASIVTRAAAVYPHIAVEAGHRLGVMVVVGEAEVDRSVNRSWTGGGEHEAALGISKSFEPLRPDETRHKSTVDICGSS